MNRLVRFLWIACLCVLSWHLAYSQTGILKGRVVDESGEPLLGAHVTVATHGVGAVTGLAGDYVINALPVGVYEVSFSYVSYETKRISGVKISSGSETVLNVELKMDAQVLEGVEIAGERTEDNAVALLDLQRKSIHLMEGLSVEDMRQKGDNVLGSAVRRIAGVSVEDGKYFYVRGLGDRYNSVHLNGAYVPSLDPTRNTIQLDLFPSYLIENVVLYKAFSADLPGDFAGGHLDISLKSIPNDVLYNLSYSTGYNDRTHLNNQFLAYTGSGTDWLGFDNGKRALPSQIQAQGVPTLTDAEQDSKKASQLQAVTGAFENQEMNPYTKRVWLDQRINLAYGNRHHFLSRPFGYLVSLTYANEKDAYRNGAAGKYEILGQQNQVRDLNPLLSLDDNRSTRSAHIGGLVSLGYALAPTHDLSISFMHNQKGESTARSQQGTKPEDDPDLHYLTHGLWYTERAMTSLQVKGKHQWGAQKNWNMEWTSSLTRSRIENPDLRFFTYGYVRPLTNETNYIIQPSIGQLPSRYFRDLREDITDTRFHLRKSFNEAQTAYWKGGLGYSHKARLFREQQYRYDSPYIALVPFGNPSAYVASDNIWSRTHNPNGVYLVDETIAANNYDGDQRLMSAYAMGVVPFDTHWELNAGLRYEYTNLALQSQDTKKAGAQLNKHDLLPSVALTYRVNEQTNVRALYGRTVARPTFRELAPYASFSFIGDYVEVGNASLERARIDNLDLRVEYFPAAGEILSASLFAKRFYSPIERTFNIEASNTELTYRNVDQAQLMGAELNARKGLEWLTPALKSLTLGLNAAWIHSAVQIDEEELMLIRAYNPSAKDTRPMFGQSPYIVNASLGYHLRALQMDAQIYYNIFGERISVVTEGGPNVHEQPRHDLGITLSKKWNKHWAVRARLNNLLDAPYHFTQTIQDKVYTFRRYEVGRSYSLALNFTP